MQNGLIHIYCGDGKGKTTAAVGLATRCAGGGGRVLIYQFLKDGSSNEIKALEMFEKIRILKPYTDIKFTKNMTAQEKENASVHYKKVLVEISEMVKQQHFDLLVLDEVVYAINLGYLKVDELLHFLKHKPKCLEVVLTGRNPSESLCEMADYISEIKKIRHPFEKGVAARNLIEK